MTSLIMAKPLNFSCLQEVIKNPYNSDDKILRRSFRSLNDIFKSGIQSLATEGQKQPAMLNDPCCILARRVTITAESFGLMYTDLDLQQDQTRIYLEESLTGHDVLAIFFDSRNIIKPKDMTDWTNYFWSETHQQLDFIYTATNTAAEGLLYQMYEEGQIKFFDSEEKEIENEMQIR